MDTTSSSASRDSDILAVEQDDEAVGGVAGADAHAVRRGRATNDPLHASMDAVSVEAHTAADAGIVMPAVIGETDATDAAPREPFHAHDTGAVPVVIVAPTGDGSGDVVVSEWTQCVNDHGETYYCNVYTGETSWQLPVLESAPGAQDGRSDALHDATEGSALAAPDGAPSPPRHAHRHDAGHPPTRSSLQLVQQVLDGELKRLDRNVQLQLEETRRRHRELEDLRDEEVRLGGEHWVEMYDPTHARFYYYGTFSGDLRWDKPPTYVLTVASDAVLRVVVKLQCAFRMTLARRRVFERKRQLMIEQQRLVAAQRSSMDDGSDASALDGALPLIDETVGALDDSSVWVEVYDPFHRVVYYYCAATGVSRWDPPSVFISAMEDKEMAAAIAIQSLSRSFLARRAVQQRKRTLRTQRQAQAMAEARRLREVRHAAFLLTSDDVRESSSRREMIEEEMEQIRHGDRFWGLDAHDREVRRQQTEERLLASAEVFWQRVNLTMKLRSDRHALRIKELERERHELEGVAEALARDAMSAEEAQQRALHDNFWGIQGEEQREAQARRDMADEERASRSVGRDVDLRARHVQWRIEADAARVQALRDAVVHEKRSQTQYMKWFYQHCRSVDDLLEYVWPGMQRGAPHKATASVQASSATSYVLDDLVVKQRLANGDLRYGSKSIVTIHDPHSAQVLGRKGGYAMATLTQTQTVYERAAANRPIESTSPARPAPPRIERTPEEEEHLRMGTAVHYQRSKTPDPHLPARFNGVPFKPSQISPTRDILCSAHTKLTQLPSLKTSSPRKSTTHWVKKPRTHGAAHALRHRSNNQRSRNASAVGCMPASSTRALLQRHEALFGRDRLETIDPMTTSFGFLGPFATESAFHRRHRLEYDVGGVREDSDEWGSSDESRDDEHDADSSRQRTVSQVAQQHRRDALAQQFGQDERELLRHVFVLMDYDRSGAVTQQEMTWALQRDEEIAALVPKSAVLRAFTKDSALLGALFDRSSPQHMQQQPQSELSWDVFAAFCEQTYVDLMNQREQPDEADSALSTPRTDAREQQSLPSRATYCEDTEEQTIRELFDLLDTDANGVLEVEELEHALATAAASDDDTIAQLVQTSAALQPLLHHEAFLDAFRKFETADPRGISADEFVGFCLEIASIAMLNDMV